ncbi:glycosyltransferase family 2 protein [Shimia thalassica]|uniref:glycosyltransferase family 2 protein n=1 Tax=Shimia thalassica TaxID=1715693 RepID=UPI0026E36916|nr:glycosyltransferase family A protein [Shimia thalassica]MDO6799741.1 glycosyltransferase family A protein [Shimia thalassica]
MSAAQHYLNYGADLGRNPGPKFDTNYYLERYPDVAKTGQNALVHFETIGRAEGRFPSPQAEAGQGDVLARIDRMASDLWGGLAGKAFAQLQAFAECETSDREARVRAYCELAIWSHFEADHVAALRFLETAGILYAGDEEQRRLMLLAMLHFDQNRSKNAADALEGCSESNHVLLALANLVDGQERLGMISEVLKQADLVPVGLQDSNSPASLTNLSAKATPVKSDGRVSVIMPAHNAEGTIRAALQSLLAQSYEDLEIFVVDDASTDGTVEVVSDLMASDARVRLIRQETNTGAYPARNRALADISGQFITTHDADDWSHPQKIEVQVSALGHDQKLQATVSSWSRVRPDMTLTSNWRLDHRLIQLNHSSFMFRKSVVDQLGAWDDVRVSADTEFMWRVQAAFASASVRSVLPHIPLSFALDDSNSLTRTKATHVCTMFHGLRHIYREVSRHWHQCVPNGLTMKQNAHKRSMLPREILSNPDDGRKEPQVWLVGDGCDEQVIQRMLRFARSNPAQEIAVCHSPDPEFAGRIYGFAAEFPELFFALLGLENVQYTTSPPPDAPGKQLYY